MSLTLALLRRAATLSQLDSHVSIIRKMRQMFSPLFIHFHVQFRLSLLYLKVVARQFPGAFIHIGEVDETNLFEYTLVLILAQKSRD